MKKIQYIGDPESTVGGFVAKSIEIAQKENAIVEGLLRGTKVLITKKTRFDSGVEKYRMCVEKLSRVRD